MLLLGPPMAGKTSLFNTILDQQAKLVAEANINTDITNEVYFPPYDKTTMTKMGLKIFDTFEDKVMFPLSLKILDAPGTLMEKPSALIEQAFDKPSLVFVVFDMGRALEQAQMIKWTKFAI